MKSKICATCQKESSVMFRIQIMKGKEWIFCCRQCTEQHQNGSYYRYGGTWKGARH